MKRTLGFVAGVVSLGVIASCVGGPVQAQAPNYAPAPGAPAARPAGAPAAQPMTQVRTKVATVNLIQIIKTYQKCQACEQVIKDQIGIVDKQMEAKKTLLVNMKTEAENPNTQQARREQIEKQFKTVQREMQEMDEEFKAQFNKKRGEMAVQLYREIEDAVQSYARANDIELVLHYNDAISPQDLYNPMNIQRKMQAGGCLPMYITPGMDITTRVVDMLNARYQSASAGQPARPAGN